MRTLVRSLFVASALLFVGCAVESNTSTEPSDDETELSQDELSKLSKKFVATWNYDTTTTDTTKFYNRITLGADSTYSSYRTPFCPPGRMCPLYVITENGTWNVSSTKLTLKTDKGEKKVFTAGLSGDGLGLKLSNSTGHALFHRNLRVGETCGGDRIAPIPSCEDGLVCFGPELAADGTGKCMKPVAEGGGCGFRVQKAPCADGLVCRHTGGPLDALNCAKPLPPADDFCGGIAGIVCKKAFHCVLDGTYPDAGGHCEECPLPPCARPPEGCHYEATPVPVGTCPTSCGKLVCTDGL
jgi:hypothetical protein